jgi:hypothetical protein
MKRTLSLILLLMTVMVAHSQTNFVVIDKSDRTPIQLAELKTPITELIIKDYAGFIINQATRIVTKNVITYEIIIVQGTTTDTLIFDQNYFFVRKIAHNDSIKPIKKIKQ